jgi:hypothetical protein
MLCYCDFMWKEMRNCRVGGAETMRLPFDCPMVTLTLTLTPIPTLTLTATLTLTPTLTPT